MHTPGPWTWTPKEAWDDDLLDFDTLQGLEYGDVLFGVWHNDSTSGIGIDNVANATLIAAAPELLEACRVALLSFSPNHAPDNHYQIQRAVAKAVGEQP